MHGSRKRHARHPCGASRDLNQQLDRGTLGTEDGLYTRAALPSDRCHLNDMAVRVNRKYRGDPPIGEEDIVERLSASMRTCSRWQRMCSSSSISRLIVLGGRASKSRLRGHFDETFIPLNRVRFALVPRGRVGRESIILPFNATRRDMSAKGWWSQPVKNGHQARAVHVLVKSDSNAFSVSVSDPGSGPDSAQTTFGLGTRLVDALARQIHATITRQSLVESYAVTITVPHHPPEVG